MIIKVGNQKAARQVLSNDECGKCVFYLESLHFCLSMKCSIYGVFHQTGTSEDIFKL